MTIPTRYLATVLTLVLISTACDQSGATPDARMAAGTLDVASKSQTQAAVASVDIAAVAKSCGGCHRGSLGFSEESVESLSEAISDTLAAQTHPAPLPELTATQIAELATALTAK